MSVAEIEQKVIELTEEERRQFAAWFYRNEERFLPADPEGDEVADDLSPEVMAELVRRRRELDSGTVKTYSLDEVVRGMREVVHEVRRSSH